MVGGLSDGKSVDEIIKGIDLRASVIKPVHAKWRDDVFTELSRKTHVIEESFNSSTITKAVQEAILHWTLNVFRSALFTFNDFMDVLNRVPNKV